MTSITQSIVFLGTELTISVRPGTKDSAVIEEVITKRCYRHTRHKFDVEPEERWLDLGAHIGCFSLYALTRGASYVAAYEPHPENVAQLNTNLTTNYSLDKFDTYEGVVSNSKNHSIPFFETSSGHNTKYTSLVGGRTTNIGSVNNFNFLDIVSSDEPQGIKMDIEGAEHAILDNLTKLPKSVTKMALEYHFTKDKYLANFKRRVDNLRKVFKEVYYPAHLDRMLADGVETFPGHFDRIIFCKR